MRISDWSSDACSSDLLKPLKTLGEVQALAAREGIKYHRGKGTLDAMQAPPELVEQIVALPPGEVFILPAGEATLANPALDTRTSPVTENTWKTLDSNYHKTKHNPHTIQNK